MTSRSPSPKRDETTNIELENWTDSESQLENGHSYNTPDPEDNDSADDLDDLEGRQALLGSHDQTRVRGPERISSRGNQGMWHNVKGIVIEAAPTLLFTTIGLLFTGELLDQVSRWRAMVEVDQLIMIIPVVLNLKGNLEMNLSARLGTAANMGELDDKDVRRTMIFGNLTLLQLQATVVSFVAACVAMILGLMIPPTTGGGESAAAAVNGTTAEMLFSRRPRPILPVTEKERDSGLATFIMLASTAMTAASLSALLLGSFMCTLIVLCRRFGRDPDNIAPPIASCLGDLVTLCCIGLVSKGLINFLHTPVTFIVCLLVVGTAAICTVFTRRNPMVKDLIFKGWSPLFGAMAISSATGIVLDLFVTRYEGFALLAVVISGLPGAVGAIFVSRLSTALHAASLKLSKTSAGGTVDDSSMNPKLVMTTLLIITLPVEVIFLAVLHGLGWLQLPFIFVAFSVLFFCCAVVASLIIGRYLTNFLWKREYDPDLYAMPLHSALMDLIGQLLLVLCFEIVRLLGAKITLKNGATE